MFRIYKMSSVLTTEQTLHIGGFKVEIFIAPRNDIFTAAISDPVYGVALNSTAASWEFPMRESILTALISICVVMHASVALAAAPVPDTIRPHRHSQPQ
jgi:hypothetical protein